MMVKHEMVNRFTSLIKNTGKMLSCWYFHKMLVKMLKYSHFDITACILAINACNLIKCVLKENKNKNVKVYFGNGGDRNDSNSPEVNYCNENNVDILWGVGGRKIQSSSNLIKGVLE